MVNVAVHYNTGMGVSLDHAEAVKWCRKAAVAGEPMGMINLAASDQKGQGVPQSNSEAVEWYYKASQIFLAKNAKAAAQQCYDRIVRLSPDHPLVGKLRGELDGPGQP